MTPEKLARVAFSETGGPALRFDLESTITASPNGNMCPTGSEPNYRYCSLVLRFLDLRVLTVADFPCSFLRVSKLHRILDSIRWWHHVTHTMVPILNLRHCANSCTVRCGSPPLRSRGGGEGYNFLPPPPPQVIPRSFLRMMIVTLWIVQKPHVLSPVMIPFNRVGFAAMVSGEDRANNASNTDEEDQFMCQPKPNVTSDSSPDAGHLPNPLTLAENLGLDTSTSPTRLKFTAVDIFGIVFSFLTYVVDVSTDVILAALYVKYERYEYFLVTLLFIAFSSIVTTAVSLRWYIHDAESAYLPEVTLKRWTFRIICLLLQFGPLLRYADALWFGMKFCRTLKSPGVDKQKIKAAFYLMVFEDADSTLLRIFQCFMQSAPQLVFQFFILSSDVYHNQVNPKICQLHSVFKYIREKLISRVLALSLFASLYTKWIFLVLALHWFIMVVWIGITKAAACNSKCEETFFNIILAYIYTFTFLNIKNEPTRYKYLLYYSFCFFENTVLITLWFSYIMDSGMEEHGNESALPFTKAVTKTEIWFSIAETNSPNLGTG
ncbi:unnamed protein product [Darwinula stevensoni]|uniref:XK-related protein n=1 Tax=Darwinula stevensoni TaxID=69355 RepID=A0A7R8XJF4_9CRUS|nr:unnamed protein product [Darwinula stevensoni]CAG0892170.1 unnamed protein product [Darwinula stevensoni]